MHQHITITKDFENKTITVERHFPAPLDSVWEAYTTGEILEQWWAPKPWKAVTKSFTFAPGGHWHYYMSSPEGEKVWAIIEYQSIEPKKSFTAIDGFCDEEGNKSKDMMKMEWHNAFSEKEGVTTLLITITFEQEKDMHTIVEMGFEEGFSMGLNNLEELLASKKAE